MQLEWVFSFKVLICFYNLSGSRENVWMWVNRQPVKKNRNRS